MTHLSEARIYELTVGELDPKPSGSPPHFFFNLTYIGTWLPEPVDTSCDPGIGTEFSCRDGVPVTLGTIDASAQGIDQIMWFLRPSKLWRSQSQAKDCATVTSLDRLPPSWLASA